jgi:aspartate/methionine/tyrosine aminotransferase
MLLDNAFRLKPTRAAKVSEISEVTAAAAVAPEDRVNFHIGNPVQEAPLSSAYLRAVAGLDIRDESLRDDAPEEMMQTLNWSENDRPVYDLLVNLVRKSAPYLPRGGFSRATPPPLVQAFSDWLLKQQEPLVYDTGKASERREIILASGGRVEALRVFFHAISMYLVSLPSRVMLFHIDLPRHVTSFAGLRFETLPSDERHALDRLHTITAAEPALPLFLVLGSLPSEETRHALRNLSLEAPVFFVEVNDAQNHQSLGREARLVDRVIRFLSPGIFSPRFAALSIVFVAGNAEYLALLETLHFQLKGSPSASEVELLSFLLEHQGRFSQRTAEPPRLTVEAPLEPPAFGLSAEVTLARMGKETGRVVESLLTTHADAVTSALAGLDQRAERLLAGARKRIDGLPIDLFVGVDARALVAELVGHVDDPQWHDDLQQALLAAFVRHHPEYDPRKCTVVSGSSRTALGFLGFHCGITDVVMPDLSWTYEHCFPATHAVPLTQQLGIDREAIVHEVDERIRKDGSWVDHGAVVLNNPHNATGRVFDIASVRELTRQLLERGVRVIDDLSYQNVAPSRELPEIPTLCQLADELVAAGSITALQAGRVITVHSMSKTDCMAGARLCIVEIRDIALLERFREVISSVRPNTGAILLSYLFYRNSIETTRAYWRLRNRLLCERMEALTSALENLPAERNPFSITIYPPTGSMYPLLVIDALPAGLSLEWVGSGLARQGIGMVPLSTFARTEKGFETGRKAFRLTLGGTDPANVLQKKTRRVLIDLNHIIAEESAQYQRSSYVPKRRITRAEVVPPGWESLEVALRIAVEAHAREIRTPLQDDLRDERIYRLLMEDFLPSRLSVYRQRYLDRFSLAEEYCTIARHDNGKTLGRTLEREFFKDDLGRRQRAFRERLYDRTVHPTQMYSIQSEAAFDAIVYSMIRGGEGSHNQIEHLATDLVKEFLGLSVAITSSDEAGEIIIDLDALITAELGAEVDGAGLPRTFLSFWGDWDGSNRPSGQGHRLVGSVLIENVRRMSRLLRMLMERDSTVRIAPELHGEMERLQVTTRQFVELVNQITGLTHQLERRYRGILPFYARAGALRRIGMSLHIASDPVTTLWHHNDRLERRMLDLRRKRREALESYASLNKRLRKELHGLIPALRRNIGDPALLREAVLYRDLLQRIVITPRIQQNMVTAQDQFAIDTTVFNITEINEIGAQYGNPGLVLGLQVSMSSKPEALIALDRKFHARREHVLRDNPHQVLPSVWLIPLFEDAESVRGLGGYLTKLWDHALQSRRLGQETGDRFAEMISEIFVAGSDLSQNVSQAAGGRMYRQAKYDLMHWLGERGLADRVRMKLGSGEPMQRQGGYYGELSGKPAFVQSEDSERRFAARLRASTRRSTLYAATPMLGVFSGGDLRTFQSAISERLRHLPVQELTQLLHHVMEQQHKHKRDLIRACEEFADSRFKSTTRGEQTLERLTIGPRSKSLDGFLEVLTENFRQILYGRDEDVVGLHIISYFIARTTPPLRDRPTVRPGQPGKEQGNRILERIADTIPSSRYGSMLRAIAHNQAQTAVLGVNQLTVGLFRALDTYAHRESIEGDPETFIADRLLPHLPVYEILHTLRLYQDPEPLHAMERAFPAGNSALLALREDMDAMEKYILLFQQELLRRHGVDVGDFFKEAKFAPSLLPTLRPDLAVLLQPDLFNTDIEKLRDAIEGPIEQSWLDEVRRLLRTPVEIRFWRSRAWALLERPVFQRVEAFVELAVALYSISSKLQRRDLPLSPREVRLPSALTSYFRMAAGDDEMRQFLAAAVEYLNIAAEGQLEVPATIIRAMKEVERIAAIEEQALNATQQDRLRFYLLQIARLAGENG